MSAARSFSALLAYKLASRGREFGFLNLGAGVGLLIVQDARHSLLTSMAIALIISGVRLIWVGSRNPQ